MSRKRNNHDIAASEDENSHDDSNSSKRRRQAATQDSLLDDGLENDMDLDKNHEEEDEEYQEEEAAKISKSKTKSKGKGKQKKSRNQDDDEEEIVETDEDNIEEEENDELNSDEEEIKEEIEASRKNTGAIAESGVIEKVELTNFMCHKRQTVKFGPQLNFLIGHNGSGKSAFLTAITVALGGKASSTSRGHSFKTFVREGCSTAEVILTLRNKGEEAYKREIYGDRIIIERRINADGGGSWKIKSAEGKTISTKKEELNALTDHCNIQVDNPLNVLSQDAARSFLSSSKADEKYKFFLNGTQLTQLANEYTTVSDVIKKIEVSLNQQGQALPELEEKKKEQVEKYKLAEKAREQMKKLEQINKLMVWSQVTDKENELKGLIRVNEKAKGKLDTHRRELLKAEEQLRKAEAAITENENLRDGASDRTEPLKNQRDQIKHQLRQLKLKEKHIIDEERTTNEQYNNLKGQINDLEDQIEEETRKRIEGDRQKQARRDRYEDDRARLTSEISTLKAEFADLADQIKTSGQELDQVKARQTAANNSMEQARGKLSHQQQIHEQLKGASTNQLLVFGRNIPNLVRAIDNEKRWKQKPIGPIGKYVKVKDPAWSGVIENVIGKTLNAFCVTNHNDRALLQQLIRRSNCNRETSIITASQDNFDYSSGEPDENITTILRVLEIQNEYIKRQLITSSHIESNALIETRAAATELIRNNTRNVKRCYTKDNLMVMGNDQSTSTSTLTEHKGASRLTRDTSAQLNECKHRIDALQKEVQAATAEVRRITMERQGLERTLKSHNDRQPNITRQIRSLQNQCSELEDDMNEDAPETTAALESAKRDAEEELQGMAAAFSSIQSRKESILNDVEPLEERDATLVEQIQAISSSYQSVNDNIEQAVTERLTAQKKRTHHEKYVNDLTPKVREDETAINEAEAELNEWTEQALQYCDGERLEVNQTHAEYMREKAALEQASKRNARRGETDLKVIIADMQAFAKRFDDAKKEFDDMDGLRMALKNSLDARLLRWADFRTLIAARAKMLFAFHLQHRGYSGKLSFDHNGIVPVLNPNPDPPPTLVIECTPELDPFTPSPSPPSSSQVQTEDPNTTQASGKRSRKDPTSLSGGEKSFSTICLLLSLWEAIGCPIRCLDEFDVFMDAVNRKIAMDMMITNAKASNSTQFVLITPQGMQNYEGTEGVYITKMNDPVRNQATLN